MADSDDKTQDGAHKKTLTLKGGASRRRAPGHVPRRPQHRGGRKAHPRGAARQHRSRPPRPHRRARVRAQRAPPRSAAHLAALRRPSAAASADPAERPPQSRPLHHRGRGARPRAARGRRPPGRGRSPRPRGRGPPRRGRCAPPRNPRSRRRADAERAALPRKPQPSKPSAPLPASRSPKSAPRRERTPPLRRPDAPERRAGPPAAAVRPVLVARTAGRSCRPIAVPAVRLATAPGGFADRASRRPSTGPRPGGFSAPEVLRPSPTCRRRRPRRTAAARARRRPPAVVGRGRAPRAGRAEPRNVPTRRGDGENAFARSRLTVSTATTESDRDRGPSLAAMRRRRDKKMGRNQQAAPKLARSDHPRSDHHPGARQPHGGARRGRRSRLLMKQGQHGQDHRRDRCRHRRS